MAAKEEEDYEEARLEFPKSTDPLMADEIGGTIGGDVGGEIFIPMETEADEGTLDEPVSATLVSLNIPTFYLSVFSEMCPL